jgi:hypothetical protein
MNNKEKNSMTETPNNNTAVDTEHKDIDNIVAKIKWLGHALMLIEPENTRDEAAYFKWFARENARIERAHAAFARADMAIESTLSRGKKRVYA